MDDHLRVVSLQYCVPSNTDLFLTKKLLTLDEEGSFGITDRNGNLLFKIIDKAFSMHDRHVLLDPNDNPLLTFRQKIMSKHKRWRVYRGESTTSDDVVFSVKKSPKSGTVLDVFLDINTTEEICDFRIEGSWSERSCIIYKGESSTIIAQMNDKHFAQSVLLGTDTIAVTVYPYVDYAFIAALIVLLQKINEETSDD